MNNTKIKKIDATANTERLLLFGLRFKILFLRNVFQFSAVTEQNLHILYEYSDVVFFH